MRRPLPFDARGQSIKKFAGEGYLFRNCPHNYRMKITLELHHNDVRTLANLLDAKIRKQERHDRNRIASGRIENPNWDPALPGKRNRLLLKKLRDALDEMEDQSSVE
jgi:hypothetical protein